MIDDDDDRWWWWWLMMMIDDDDWWWWWWWCLMMIWLLITTIANNEGLMSKLQDDINNYRSQWGISTWHSWTLAHSKTTENIIKYSVGNNSEYKRFCKCQDIFKQLQLLPGKLNHVINTEISKRWLNRRVLVPNAVCFCRPTTSEAWWSVQIKVVYKPYKSMYLSALSQRCNQGESNSKTLIVSEIKSTT